MSFRVDHEFLVLGKPGTLFVQDFFYEWEDEMTGEAAQLFLNFSCDAPELPADALASGIFEIMKNYFFVGLERDPADRFEDTLKEINHYIQQQEEALQRPLKDVLHIIPAAITRHTLYLSQSGQAEAYLVRKRFLSTLSEGLLDPDQKNELFANIASGGVAVGDRLLFCSGRLLRHVSKTDLARLLSDESSLSEALSSLKQTASLDVGESLSVLAVYLEESLRPISSLSTEMESEAPKERSLSLSKMKLHLGRLIPEKLKAKLQGSPKESLSAEEMSMEEMSDSSHEESSVRSASTSPLKQKVVDVFQEWRALKRDKILIALVVVVAVLVVGIYLVRQQGEKQQYLEELESKLTQVETNINTAQTTGTYDKEAAQELLDEAETLALEVLNSGYLRGKANEYLTQIETQRDQLDNVYRLETPTVFVDFSTVNPSMNALGMVPMGDDLYVYEYNQLYQIILDEIQSPIPLEAEETVIDAEYYDEEEAIVFLTQSNRVLEYKDGQLFFLDTDDGSWHSAVDLELYNNRIYLLDPGQGQIWRYYAQRDGFSTAEAYIADSTVVTDGVSFAIDGALYILNSAGEIVKYVSGEKQEFLISKAPIAEMEGAIKIYTEYEMFQVFVLDSAENRVLIYNKDSKSGNLVYSAQYVFENTGELKDIYVDKESSRFYVLDKSKIYEVSY